VTVHSRRRAVRKWRSRGRRGQVAAVATILGLLLVVTFIANYLTTTLPNQMSVNDLDHELQVENQIGRLQALLEQVSAAGDVGAQVTQPVTLGSSGAPPFADADSGQIGPLNGSSFNLSYTLQGPTGYQAPTGGDPNTGYIPSSATCVPATNPTTSLTCSGSGGVTWNFSAATPTNYALTVSAGTYAINITDSGASSGSHATIAITASGSSPLTLLVLGSNDTITLTTSAAGTDVFEIVGNNDTLSIPAASSATTIVAYVVGANDAVTFGSVSANINFLGTFFGFDDSVNAGSSVSSTGNKFAVYFNGYYPATPATSCPVGNLAYATDAISGGASGKGTYSVTFNDTTTSTGTVASPWTGHWSRASTTCPFLVAVTVAPTTIRSAGFNVHLLNSYAPQADVAFDAGAVVFAQPGGVPLLIDGPGIRVIRGSTGVSSVSIWMPVFVGRGAAEAGISTADLSARLISSYNVVLNPSTSYTVANNTTISFAITTPFASGWWSYFNATYPASWLSCTGIGCRTPYTNLGDFGTVTLAIPTGTVLNYFDLDIATFSFLPL
jgi:hypothetical protein